MADQSNPLPTCHAWTHRPKELGGTDPIPVDAGGQWCRIYNNAQQTFTPGDIDVVHFGLVNNPYTDYFGTGDAQTFGDDGDSITILKSGVYAATYRLFTDSVPDVTFETDLNGIDWDETLYYERMWDVTVAELLDRFGPHDTVVFRSAPDYGTVPPPEVYVRAGVPSAASSNLVIDVGDNTITDHRATATYLEVVRIAPAEITGDPSDTGS